MKNEKRKKGKVRWLSVLLTGCLLLSVIPATAFATEDTTVVVEDKDTVAEKTQMSEQESTPGESRTEESVTDESKTDESITDESKADKSIKDESKADESIKDENKTGENNTEESSAEEGNSGESKTEDNITDESTVKDGSSEEKVDTCNAYAPGIKVNTTVRNNYTDITTNETIRTYINGIVTVDGDLSSMNGSILTFAGLGDLTIQAVYDGASNKTTLTLDISNVPRQINEQQYFTEYKENLSRMTTSYTGSMLTYTGTTTDPVTGDITVNEIRDDYYTRNIVYERECLIIPAIESITSTSVENVKFNYQPGDAPQATAQIVKLEDQGKYEIAYECWQQFENSEPVAAWYSDNGSHGSLPAITTFESGKKYVYFLMLKPKDGYSFSEDTAMTVNGESVQSGLSGNFLYAPVVKTITMPNVISIDVVEINDVTVRFKDGDKPVFTGKTPEGAHYRFRCEWWELNSNTGLISTEPEWGGGIYGNKIITFEAGKTYHYGVYVTADGDVGNDRYIFTPDTKLKINGEFMTYKRYEGDTSNGSDGSMWIITDLTMTPEASSTIPSQELTVTYTVTYTDGVDGKEVFKDQTYTVETGKATPAFSGTPARKGYTFAGWKPAVADYVTNNATYEATWKRNPAPTITPSENKPNTNETEKPITGETEKNKTSDTASSKADKTTSPKTGDTSNILLWFVMLFVSAGAAISTAIVSKKKKYNR